MARGPAVRFAGELAALIGQVEIVGIDPSLAGVEEREGVSRLVAGGVIPFVGGSFLGVALSGGVEEQDLREAARVVAPLGRVVVLGGSDGAVETLRRIGLSVLLDEEGVVVARREQPETLPLVTLRGP